MPPELVKNLANFGDLDFHVYTGQQWGNLHKSHGENILVHYPDGHTTKGILVHIKELEFMWTFAPDNRITEHSVGFGTAMRNGQPSWDFSTAHLPSPWQWPTAL
jgi:hypothetical protein